MTATDYTWLGRAMLDDLRPPDPIVAKDVIRRLSRTEYDTLRLAAAGHEDREIAARLHKSLSTVRQTMHAVYRELGVRNRTQAAVVAVQAGVI